MIEVLSPGFLSIIVDRGRQGHGHIGVPSSRELDRHAAAIARYLVDSPGDAPLIEVMGNDLRLRILEETTLAITGAKVKATLGDEPLRPWSAVRAKKDSILRVAEVLEGLRYYIAFSGIIDVEPVMGSCTTNLECTFGGFRGRPLMKGDRVALRNVREPAGLLTVPETMIPSMREPHLIRVIAGPEADHFVPRSVRFLANRKETVLFSATSRLNRTGIRLEGEPLRFRDEAERSIISEGLLPGTIQVPPDGYPIITLAERTIGSYARLATVADADMDMLAQIRPRDRIVLSSIDITEAERLWRAARDALSFYCKKQ
ncbi:MAG: KipI antagonist [Syntrophorhabdus sp. PtaB.Bin047]|nr:MAG: KipI antagonist [Syntrophorhabdus sp. PtaB.Bin047]